MRKIINIILFWGIIVSAAYPQCSAIIDLNTWFEEGPPANGVWTVNGAGTQVTQTINGNPTFFVSPQDFINVRITGSIRVATTGDDDYVGFVFGWQPIGTTPNYDLNTLLFDWKQGNQTYNGYTAISGYHLSAFDNYITNLNAAGQNAASFWGHANNPPTFTVLGSDTGPGRGWADNVTYNFELTYLSDRAIIKINNDTIFDVNGCFQPGRFGFYNFSQSQVVYSNFAYQLIPDYTMASTNVCLNDSARFQYVVDSCANLNQNNFPITTWQWDFGDGNTSTAVNPAHQYAAPGTYQVKLVIRDSIGCADSIVKQVIIDSIPPQPILAGNTPLCDGDTLNLTAQPVTNATYSWSGPNGFTSSTQNPTINTIPPAGSGNYVCTLSYGNCPGDPDSVAIVVNALPPAPNPGSNSPICTDSSLNLSAINIAGGSFTWSGPAGFAANTQNPSVSNVTGTNGGMYYVYATQNGCDGPLDSVNVVVNPTPIANITGDTTICIGDNTTLYGNGGNTYLWSTTQTGSSIIVGPAANQFYGLVAIDADGCPSLPDSTEIVVSPLPTPNLGPDTANCITHTLDAGTGYLNYLWSTGATSQTITVSNSGLYWVEVMSQDSCLGRDSANVTINTPTAVTLGPDQSKCVWDSIQLTTTPGNFTSYSWSNGSTASSIYAPTPGTYSVTVTDANGCISNDDINISDYALLTGNIGNDTTICNGASVTLSATSWNGASYLWSPGNIAQPTYTVSSTGQYSVIIDDGNNCLYYDTINVAIDLPPTLTLSNSPTDMCADNPVEFVASPAGLSGYIFNINGANQPASTSNVLNIPSPNTTQTVTVAGITALGCTSAVSLPAVTNVVPRPSGVVNTTSVCEGEATTLNLSGIVGGSSITWSGMDGLTGSGPSISYIYPSGAGSYTWSVTIDNGLCDTTISGVVPVKPVPDPPTAADVIICEGENARFEATLPGGRYEWFSDPNGGQQLGTGRNLTINTPAGSGTYYVQTTVNGCTSPLAPVNLTVNLPPVANFISTPDAGIPVNTPNTEFSFTNLTTGGTAWYWDFGDGLSDTTENPVHEYTEPGKYTVMFIATSADGCSDTLVRYPFIVENITGLWVPTGFTPNGDGLNDLFEIKFIGYLGYEIQIYDRWGRLVFDNQGNSTLFWDGTDGGKHLPEGVYVYKISAVTPDGTKVPKTGSITILR